jgi:hypothetical protein
MRDACLLGWLLRACLLAIAIGVPAGPVYAQNESLGQDAGSCRLKDHIYTCDGAKFHEALLSAETVAVDVHNWDGVARAQLKGLVTNKLGKTVVEPSKQPDLIFFLVPLEGTGVISTTDVDLGTLRIYTSTSDGSRGHLLWAETYSGPQVPWPAVVRGLIRQFQGHFQIK